MKDFFCCYQYCKECYKCIVRRTERFRLPELFSKRFVDHDFYQAINISQYFLLVTRWRLFLCSLRVFYERLNIDDNFIRYALFSHSAII